MLDALPRRALFRFEIPLHYCAKFPRLDADLSKWNERFFLPPLVEIEDEEAIADVSFAWNEEGVVVGFDVPDRSGTLQCDPNRWWKKDGVRICLDTRDARENKRATRYCHLFYVLPTGGGAKGTEPAVGIHRMNRAKEPPPAVDVSQIEVARRIARRGYTLEVRIPSSCLHGWDPAEHPRIGVFYKVKDTRLGSQHLSADDELGWNSDPSTWATGVLTR